MHPDMEGIMKRIFRKTWNFLVHYYWLACSRGYRELRKENLAFANYIREGAERAAARSQVGRYPMRCATQKAPLADRIDSRLFKV
jgi:hypothetical protein